MSETVTAPAAGVAATAPVSAAPSPPAPSPPAPVSQPSSVASEPIAGATPPEAAPSGDAPAASSSDAAQSILSGAKPGETPELPAEAAPEAPAAEAAAETPTDPAPEAAPEPAQPAEPPPRPAYDALVLPEGVKLEDAKVAALDDLVGEYELKAIANPAEAHAAFAELRQKLVDTYVAQAREDADRYTRLQRENWDRTQEQWQTEFRNDPRLGRNRQETTLARLGALMDMYGSREGAERLQSLRDAFNLTGMGNHPEMLRFAHFMASRLTETARVVTPTLPKAAVAPTTKAGRLYRNSQGAA